MRITLGDYFTAENQLPLSGYGLAVALVLVTKEQKRFS
jgi:hypothetical protein